MDGGVSDLHPMSLSLNDSHVSPLDDDVMLLFSFRSSQSLSMDVVGDASSPSQKEQTVRSPF